MTKRILKFLFLFSGIMAFSFSAVAAKRYWVGTGANKNWNSTGNWSSTSGGSSGSSVPGTSDTAYYDGNGLGQCSINTTASVRRLEVGAGYTDTIKQTTFTFTAGVGGMVLSGGVFWGGSAAITDGGIFTLSGMIFKSTSGALTVTGNYTFSSGTFSNNSGEVIFAASGTLTGNTTFYNLTFNPGTGTGTYTIAGGTTLICTNLLKTSGSGAIIINTGNIDLQGDLTISNTNITNSGGGSGTITIDGTGSQTINGASVEYRNMLCNIVINKSSGTLTLKDYISINGNYTYTSGTIDATTNSSTLVFGVNISGRTIVPGNTVNYNNVSFYANFGVSPNTIGSTDTMNVTGELRVKGASVVVITTGTIAAKGDIVVTSTNTQTTQGGTGTILINGTGAQTLTGSGTVGQGCLAGVKIDKASGTLTLKSITSVNGNWTYSRGTIDASTFTSTVAFANGTRNIAGTHSLYNVSFYGNGANSVNNIGSSDTLKVLGELRNEGGSATIINTGVVNAKGNITITNSNSGGGGTGTIYISGTAKQILTGQSGVIGILCNVKINKSGDTLILKNITTVAGNWVYTAGTVDPTTYSSTVIFPGGTRTISGKQNFYNVNFYAPASSTNNITSTDTLTVLGELKFSGTNICLVNSGIINAKSDITITNTGSVVGGGSGTINICGTGSQTLTGSGTALQGSMCNVKVNKDSGILYLSSIITLASTATWKYIKGTVDPGSSVFSPIGGSDLDCGNSSLHMLFNNVSILNGTTAVTLSGMLCTKGDVVIAAARALTTNSNDLIVRGNWNNSGTYTGGTSKITLNGNTHQYIKKSSGTETFYKLEVNKSAGRLRLYSPVAVSNTLTLTKGAIGSTSANIISMPDNAIVSGGSDSSYVSGSFKKTGNDAFTFPLGDTVLSSGAYHPLSITAPGVTTDAFTAQYYSVNQTAGNTKVDSIDLSTCEYWTIARNVGSSNVKTTLGWNTNNCHSANAYDMVVSGWDGTNSIWKSLESTNITITGSKGTVTASATPYWNGTNAVNVMIAKKKAINITERIHEPYCFTGTTKGFAHIGVTYGAPPFTYAWSNSATTPNIDSLTAGTYSLTITDRYSRTFTRNYTLENCTKWSTLPTGLTYDTTGLLYKSTGDSTWATAQSTLILDTLQTGRWIKFTVADTASTFLVGFGPVAVDSMEEEANLLMFMEGSVLTVIETDNDGFYSKEVIGNVAINDELKVEMDESQGILYYKNNQLIHTGKLLSDSRLQLTASIYGSNKSIKKIRCSSNN